MDGREPSQRTIRRPRALERYCLVSYIVYRRRSCDRLLPCPHISHGHLEVSVPSYPLGRSVLSFLLRNRVLDLVSRVMLVGPSMTRVSSALLASSSFVPSLLSFVASAQAAAAMPQPLIAASIVPVPLSPFRDSYRRFDFNSSLLSLFSEPMKLIEMKQISASYCCTICCCCFCIRCISCNWCCPSCCCCIGCSVWVSVWQCLPCTGCGSSGSV